jgi:putative hemolysin
MANGLLTRSKYALSFSYNAVHGKREMILECTYRSLESGVFVVEFWICCRSEASLVSSLRLLASRLQKRDPSFLQLPSSVSIFSRVTLHLRASLTHLHNHSGPSTLRRLPHGVFQIDTPFHDTVGRPAPVFFKITHSFH